MPGLVDINLEEAEKKVSFFKRNYYEIGFMVMAIVIGYLFVGQKQLERDWRNFMITDNKATVEKVGLTTIVIQENTTVMKDVKDVLKENSGTLKRIEENLQERNLKR